MKSEISSSRGKNERFGINSVGDGIGSHLEMSKVNIMLKWSFHEANENGYDLQLSALQEEEQKNLMVRTDCVWDGMKRLWRLNTAKNKLGVPDLGF